MGAELGLPLYCSMSKHSVYLAFAATTGMHFRRSNNVPVCLCGRQNYRLVDGATLVSSTAR